MKVLRYAWRAWEFTWLPMYPVLCLFLLVTRQPVPLLGAAWWPLWIICLGLGLFSAWSWIRRLRR